MKLRTKIQLALLTGVCALAFLAGACGDDADDPKVWVAAMCNKYDECEMWDDMFGMLGNSADECKSIMNEMIDENPNEDPDPTSGQDCDIDADQCLSDFKSMSCEDLKAGNDPASCDCE